MAVPEIRSQLARDGIFNTRDLGGLTTGRGSRVRYRRLVRADALHRLNRAKDAFVGSGVTRVIDLRDDAERERAGVLEVDGVEVVHQPMLDPAFGWISEDELLPTELLRTRYKEILGSFGDRLVASADQIASVVADDPASSGAVAFHCALGKDRTGLLSAMLLSILGVEREQIVADYVRSANATAVQIQWLWSFGHVDGDALDMDLREGLWSARPETMRETLEWVDAEFGGFTQYALDQGLDPAAVDNMRARLLVPVASTADAAAGGAPDAVGIDAGGAVGGGAGEAVGGGAVRTGGRETVSVNGDRDARSG